MESRFRSVKCENRNVELWRPTLSAAILCWIPAFAGGDPQAGLGAK